MFLLSLIPIPVTSGENNKSLNKIDSIEAKIKTLESFITSKHLGLDFDADYSKEGYQTVAEIYYKGNNNEISIDFAQQELEKAKQEDIELRSTTGLTTSDNSPVDRLSEIYNKLTVAQVKINDLQNLDQALREHKEGGKYDTNPNMPGIQIVSDLGNGINDWRAVEAELQKTINYQNDLKSAADFWKKVKSAHKDTVSKEIKQVTEGEMFWGTKESFGGIKRLESLHDLLNSLIKGKGNDPYVPGLNTPENPNGAKDANVIRQEIRRVLFEFEVRLEKAREQSWYPELKAEMQQRLTKTEAERKNAEKEAMALEKQLSGLMQNPNSTPDKINSLRQEVYRKQALVGELNAESEYLNVFLNPQNTKPSIHTTATPSNTSKPNPNSPKPTYIKAGIAISEFDTNKDGIYDFDEWKTELARMGISIPKNFQLTPGLKNFKEHGIPISCLDGNGDGYLNQEDIKDFIKAGGNVEKLDLNGDGIFDYKDTVQGLKGYGINITPEQEKKIKQREQEIFGNGISIKEVMQEDRKLKYL